MSESDPIFFAAVAAGLSESELLAKLQQAEEDRLFDDWHRALVDEVGIRFGGKSGGLHGRRRSGVDTPSTSDPVRKSSN